MRGLALVGLVLGVAACSADESTSRVVVTGSSTIAPLLGDMAKRYEAENPGLRIDVQTGGSARGIADARKGIADIGMVSRRLKAEESDLSATMIAMDGLAIIVHADNSVGELSAEQVVKIYRDEVNDWSEVGGRPGPITVVHKAEGRSTLELFLKHFSIENRAVKPDVVIGDNEQGIKTVAGNPGAIAYVSVGVAEIDAAKGAAIRALPLGGVEAKTAHVKDGTFPLRRELNLVTGADPTPAAAAFLTYATSPGVEDLLDKHAVVAPR